MKPDMAWFKEARYGLFMHYGLYSLLGRGEWVMNREAIPAAEYEKLKDRFTAEKFDLDDIIRRARDWGMTYAVLTTKHHDGFCLYDSKLTDYKSTNSPAKRDLTAEFVAACRKYGLRIGLYHTLNEWHAVPSSVDALEKPETCYQPFIDFVHAQIRDLLTSYGKVDVMWYDGWWPFDGKGWQAEKLNAMVRELQPGILLNGRTGLRGDFSTPEGHIAVKDEPWEACLPLNDHWCHHVGDNNWKRPTDIVEMLRVCSAGCGNLLLDIGPRGDGSVPEPAIDCLDRVGAWIAKNRESLWGTEKFVINPRVRGEGRAEWSAQGPFTASANAIYWHIRHWVGSTLTLAGVKCTVTEVAALATGQTYRFVQTGDKLVISGLPETADTTMPIVLRLRTKDRPMLYLTGGVREPKVAHCHYDPVEPDIQY